MAKLLYSVTMSVDGFIAGAGGDMSWLVRHLGQNPLVDELIRDIGALLVGRRTFGGDDPHRGTEKEGKAFGGGWSGPLFVLTHHIPDAPVPDVTFVGDLDSGVAAAKAAAGDRYVNILGASVARQCLEAGVLAAREINEGPPQSCGWQRIVQLAEVGQSVGPRPRRGLG